MPARRWRCSANRSLHSLLSSHCSTYDSAGLSPAIIHALSIDPANIHKISNTHSTAALDMLQLQQKTVAVSTNQAKLSQQQMGTIHEMYVRPPATGWQFGQERDGRQTLEQSARESVLSRRLCECCHCSPIRKIKTSPNRQLLGTP